MDVKPAMVELVNAYTKSTSPTVSDIAPGMSKCLSVARLGLSTRNSWDRMAPTAPIGTFTNIMDLQPKVAVRTPPSMEPAANPAGSTEMKMPKARFLSLPSGNVSIRMANAVTVDMAAPTPWTPLAMTRVRREGDSQPVSEAAVNMTIPSTNSFFWPYTSPALPLNIRKPAKVSP